MLHLNGKFTIYKSDVRLYLISFTSKNCSKDKHNLNKELANKLGIKHYLLFSNWYHSLEEEDILYFIDDITTHLK